MGRMPNYLSNYLSGSRTMKTAGSSQYPVIKRYTPYASSQSRGINAAPTSAPYANQDLASALLYQQQLRQNTTPSSTFTDNYNYDPIQSKIQALGSQSVANAQTNASQLRKEAAINQGDPELLRSLGFDENTINAASGNPQSLLSQLNLEYQNRQKQLSDSLSAQNLYYSGENQRQLGLLAQGKATAESNIGQKLRDLLAGVDSGVLGSQENARQADLKAQLDAAATAQSNALYSELLATLGGPPPANTTPGAPTTLSGGVTYAGYPSAGPQIPTSPDTTNMTPEEALAAQQAYAAAMEAFNAQKAVTPRTYF